MSERPVKSRVPDHVSTHLSETAPAAAAAVRATGSASPFVGRERELAELAAALEDARQGSGRVVHVTGEAGMGKTRIAGVLERRARERGFRVLAGRCREEPGAPAYWPWVQVMRAYAADRGPRAIVADLGAYAADVLQIVPTLRAELHEVRAAPLDDPEQVRFRAFDGVAQLLRRAATGGPLLLVIDDLHWADPASLGLLTFIAQQVSDARIVLLCTSRPEETRHSDPLSRCVAELARHDWLLRIPLGGLTAAEVGRYVAVVASTEPSDALVERVHRVTEGNPLYVTEVVRLLAAEDAAATIESRAIAIPESLRAVIRERLARLSTDTVRMLEVAAIIGREFDLTLLERVAGPVATLPKVEEALQARILAEVRARPGRCRFSHALVRETLQGELSVSRRIELHRIVGEALEEGLGGNAAEHVAELAHHFWSCAPGGDAAKAVRYLVAAAEAASTALAYEEAAESYERALRLLDLSGGDERRACELLLLASESHARAGDAEGMRRGFAAAARTARRLGLNEALARAALGFAGPVATLGVADNDAIRLLEEALDALPATESPLRARVLARLAMEASFSSDGEPGRELSGEALALARRVGDAETLALAIGARRQETWLGEGPAQRRGELDDLVRHAEASGDGRVAMLARHWRLVDLLELAEVARLEVELDTFGRLATERRDPLSQYRAAALRSTLALMQGRFEDAERLAEDFLARGQRVSPVNALQAYYAQKGFADWLRGRPEASVALVEPMVRAHPGLPVWRAGLIALYAELGRTDESRAEVDRIAADDFAAVPQTVFRLPAAAVLAHAIWLLGDASRARVVHGFLAPYSGRNVVIGLGAVACGAADVYLGMTSATVGDLERAESELERGIALDDRMGARPYAVLGRHALACTLLARDAAGDHARARELIFETLRSANDLGMATMAGWLDALATRVASDATIVVPESVSADGVAATLRREGEYWSVGTGTALFRLKDTIGLRCLAELLRQPGREILALDLAAAAHGADPGERRTASTATDVMLDARARASYRERLAELRADLEEAHARNDLGRAQRVESEIGFVTEELSRAVGLGGRPRATGSAGERARQNVTRAIWKAVRRIATNDAHLGRHLERTIRTGTFCSYDPPATSPLAWRL